MLICKCIFCFFKGHLCYYMYCYIAGASTAVTPPKKGKKRNAASAEGLEDFKIEYAKSARAVCRGCEQKIMKDEVKILLKMCSIHNTSVFFFFFLDKNIKKGF